MVGMWGTVGALWGVLRFVHVAGSRTHEILIARTWIDLQVFSGRLSNWPDRH